MEKIKLSEASMAEVYTDEYGWVSSKIQFTVTASVGQNQPDNRRGFSQDKVYVKDGDRYRHLTTAEFLNINKNHLYVNSRSNYYYSIDESNAVEIFNPEVTVDWNGIKSIEELTSIEVYEFKEGRLTPRTLMDYEILPQMLVQFCDTSYKGTYIVKERFEQPNRENKLCVVEPLVSFEGDKRQAVVINAESKRLCTVPYVEYETMPNEFDVFNQPLREPDLQVLLRKQRLSRDSSIEKFNLYWQPIKEACGYTVSLYNHNEDMQLKHKLYLLQRFEIERNVHWLTIDNLMSDHLISRATSDRGFIVMLEAEDRQGNIIARTRGIDVANGKPQWW